MSQQTPSSICCSEVRSWWQPVLNYWNPYHDDKDVQAPAPPSGDRHRCGGALSGHSAAAAKQRGSRCASRPDVARRSLCPGRNAGRARPQDILRPVAVGLGAAGLRLLPRPGACLRLGIGHAGRDGRRPDGSAGPARRADAALSAGGAVLQRAFLRFRGRGRRKRRQWPDRRVDLGRPGRSRRRPGEDPAALPLRDGQQGRRRGRGQAAQAPYAGDIKTAFGETVFDNPEDSFDAAVESLATFEQSGPDFYPYSSRYDAFLAGKRR